MSTQTPFLRILTYDDLRDQAKASFEKKSLATIRGILDPTSGDAKTLRAALRGME